MTTRTERLLELLNVLVDAPRLVTRAEIRSRVPGYPDSDASFRRQFERDKGELRTMGLTVEPEDIPGTDPPAQGYRIPGSAAYLSAPGLNDDELAALALAQAAVRLEGREGQAALWKLGGDAAGGAGHNAAAATGEAELPMDAAVVALFDAVATRRRVAFTYRGAERRVDPWRLVSTRGNWYLVGHDHTRGESRTFRVARIESELATESAGSAEVPAELPAWTPMEPWRFGTGPAITARLAVDGDVAATARAAAPSAEVEAAGHDGSVILAVEVTDAEAFRSFVLDFDEHAEVLGPPELRAVIVNWLRSIVGTVASPDAGPGPGEVG